MIQNLDDFVCNRSVVCDWQGIISGSMSPKAVVLSLVFHGVTGSKVSVKLLHRTGTGTSYTDVFEQIKCFSFVTQNSSNLVPKNIPKGQPAHVTIDNSDGRQQTVTGLTTTHHTNATIYVPEIQSLPDATNFQQNKFINTPLVTQKVFDYEEYKMGKPPEPPLATGYKGAYHYLIDHRFQIDCTMSVAVSIISKEGSRPYPLISDVATCKSETGFLLVIPQPPKDNVCKYYIDFLLDMKNDQNLNFFFVTVTNMSVISFLR